MAKKNIKKEHKTGKKRDFPIYLVEQIQVLLYTCKENYTKDVHTTPVIYLFRH